MKPNFRPKNPIQDLFAEMRGYQKQFQSEAALDMAQDDGTWEHVAKNAGIDKGMVSIFSKYELTLTEHNAVKRDLNKSRQHKDYEARFRAVFERPAFDLPKDAAIKVIADPKFPNQFELLTIELRNYGPELPGLPSDIALEKLQEGKFDVGRLEHGRERIYVPEFLCLEAFKTGEKGALIYHVVCLSTAELFHSSNVDKIGIWTKAGLPTYAELAISCGTVWSMRVPYDQIDDLNATSFYETFVKFQEKMQKGVTKLALSTIGDAFFQTRLRLLDLETPITYSDQNTSQARRTRSFYDCLGWWFLEQGASPGTSAKDFIAGWGYTHEAPIDIFFGIDESDTSKDGSADTSAGPAATGQKDAGAKRIDEKLVEVAALMALDESITIKITGHSDRQGSGTEQDRKKHNKDLSIDRANGVKERLVDKFQVDEERIATTGVGEEGCPDGLNKDDPDNNPDFRKVSVEFFLNQ